MTFYNINRSFQIENISFSQSTYNKNQRSESKDILELLDFAHLISMESLHLCESFSTAMSEEMSCNRLTEIEDWIVRNIFPLYTSKPDAEEEIEAEYKLLFQGKPKKTLKLSLGSGEFLSCHLKLMLCLLPDYGFLLPTKQESGSSLGIMNSLKVQVEFFVRENNLQLVDQIISTYESFKARKDVLIKHSDIIENWMFHVIILAWPNIDSEELESSVSWILKKLTGKSKKIKGTLKLLEPSKLISLFMRSLSDEQSIICLTLLQSMNIRNENMTEDFIRSLSNINLKTNNNRLSKMRLMLR